MISEEVKRYWQSFCSIDRSVKVDTPYQVWHFGNSDKMADELAALVLSGRKTATASSAKFNELKPEDAPRPDGYSVVTDFDGRPLCIVQTTQIRHLPFGDVDAAFAADEGEGDLSHEHWRRVHWDYFTREAELYGFEFDERSIICCERFRLLFPR